MAFSDEISKKLDEEFSPTLLDVQDFSAAHLGHLGQKEHGGGHFRVRIVSEKFANLTALERHREIFRVLRDAFKDKIHALQLETYAPDEQLPNDV